MTRLTDDEVRALMKLPDNVAHDQGPDWWWSKLRQAAYQNILTLCEEVLDLRAKLAAAEELLRPRE